MRTRSKRGAGAVRAVPFLESLRGGPLTFGGFLAAIREGEEWSLDFMGKKLGVSRQNLCDVEKGRRRVTPARAARWARILGYDEEQMVQLALQAELEREGVPMIVEVKSVVRRRTAKAAYRARLRKSGFTSMT